MRKKKIQSLLPIKCPSSIARVTYWCNLRCEHVLSYYSLVYCSGSRFQAEELSRLKIRLLHHRLYSHLRPACLLTVTTYTQWQYVKQEERKIAVFNMWIPPSHSDSFDFKTICYRYISFTQRQGNKMIYLNYNWQLIKLFCSKGCFVLELFNSSGCCFFPFFCPNSALLKKLFCSRDLFVQEDVLFKELFCSRGGGLVLFKDCLFLMTALFKALPLLNF